VRVYNPSVLDVPRRAPGEPKLAGRIACVTGGGKGLGLTLVRALAREGADVALSFRESGAGALSVAEEVRAFGRRAIALRADARRPGEIAAFVEEAARELGGLDLLVNNVGVFRRSEVGALSDELLDEAFDVNVKAAVLASQAAAPHMRRRGGGGIVNVASLGALRPWKAHLPYCASKAALLMATRCLALALAPEIRVNAVSPGILDPPGAGEVVRGRIPAGRFGRHEEAVEAILFLLSGASYTTGEVLGLDGGRALN
jgi:NAD(P)-dependent dehydrogenase (short-subunit alcohol dehydrogenase family)